MNLSKTAMAIQCRGIKKTYGSGDNKVEALKGIDLDVPAGKLCLLVGPSGSGKTTLLSIITTILTPDEGELHLLGTNPFQLPETQKAEFCRNNLGVVFQSLFLIPTLTVTENVSLPLLIRWTYPGRGHQAISGNTRENEADGSRGEFACQSF